MLNPSESTKFQNLRQVLNERIRTTEGQALLNRQHIAALVALTLVTVIVIFTGTLLILLLPFLWLGVYFWIKADQRKAQGFEERLSRLSVLKRMLGCIEKNRLEHDLSTANAELLEGCAVAYRQARSALDQWQPEHSLEVRARIDAGIGNTMDEAILLHQDALPLKAEALPMGVQLGKAADTFLFGRRSTPSAPIEPAFSRTRVLVDQLRDAAHELETAAHERTGALAPPVVSGRLLEALSELRMIQQAEQELKQDLRGGA